MRTRLIAGTLVCVVAATVSHGAIQVPEGYKVVSLGQNFMGGFSYLPNGDIVGMYADPNMNENAYIGIIDANGDGFPAGVKRIYEFGNPAFGIAVKVSPDGRFILFGDSTNFAYRLFRMGLADYRVSEIVPHGGSLQGAFDFAFADADHCYVSANPGSFPATVNKILHLGLSSGEIKDVVSVSGTFAGPVDMDNEGNLYYVRGKANLAPQPRDFSMLKFSASALASALASSTVLGPGDAEEVAKELDGGYGVAWHSSGDIFVTDANNGAVYKVTPGTTPTAAFASLPGGPFEGFNAISIYRRDESFASSTPTHAELTATYLSFGTSPPETYRITSLPPNLGATVSATLLGEGDRLVLTVMAQPTSNPFDGYVVLISPGGAAYSVTPRGLIKGITAYAVNVRGLAKEFKGKLLDITIPAGVPAGTWTIYAGLVPGESAPSPAKAFALDSIEVTVE